MGRDLIIETYIQRLLDWEAPVTTETLTALANEVGLGPEEIAAVQQKAQDSLTRGRNYLEFDCFDEAIEELTQAAALDPLNVEILQTLAHTYDQRYAKQNHKADKKQAIALAKRCLEIDPSHEDAVVLISSIEHTVNRRQQLVWVGVLVAMLGGLSIPVTRILATRAQVAQVTAGLDGATGLISDGTVNSPEVDIPIRLEYPGLTLDTHQSRLDNYDDSSYYTLQAVLLNETDHEIDALRLQVDYLDKNGDAIAADSKEAIADNNATVRPGDHHAFDLIQKITPQLASVRLSVTTVDQVPAPAAYASDTPIAYTWGGNQPAQLSFNLTSRRDSFDVYDMSDTAYFDAEWVITNSGDSAIRKLKFQADFYNLQGNRILSEDILAVYGSDAPMLPGESRPIRVIHSMPKDYARYEVTVLDAE